MLREIAATLLLVLLASPGVAQTEPRTTTDEPAIVIEGDPIPAPLPPDPTKLPPPPPTGAFRDAIAGRVPFHGHYCGRGNLGGDPIDVLDATCKAHDECYDRVGDSACSCDRLIEKRSLAIADDPGQSPELRRRAASVAAAFQILPCR
ncbi:phospholipase A2 family protein [Salinarimonas soli]|uniref:Uncharacterized protein n=1 Tax=Salinarimonas soli TaxID=1638099 RepID=A0A5B2VRW2_9HYPH|nr:phospholipase A2 family protein [Salinarimonas soli]KAA2241076.1 hypothetical protein F0L46_04570 [Salinarimonas soli]